MISRVVMRATVAGLIALVTLSLALGTALPRQAGTPTGSTPGVGTPVGTPDGTPQALHAAERLQPTPCRWPIPDGLVEGGDLACADLPVPAFHGEFGTPYLWLHTIRIFATGDASRPEPLIYLAGGPGEAGGALLERFGRSDDGASLRPLLEAQDVILLDQRGTGASDPALTCAFDRVPITAPSPWFTAATPVAATPVVVQATPVVVAASSTAALMDCLDGYDQRGIDFAAFTLEQRVNDVLRLIRVLDVERVDLLAADDGTLVAQQVMRRAPERIRSAVLTAPLPLGSNVAATQVIAFDEALTAIIADCAADAACAAENPDLESRLSEAVEALDAAPVLVPAGAFGEVEITGSAFLRIIYRLAHDGRADRIASLITAVAAGATDRLAEFTGYLEPPLGLSSGARAVIACQDLGVGEDVGEEQRPLEAAGVRPVLADHQWGALADLREVCEAFGLERVESAPIPPAEGDVPVLLLRGEFDPATRAADAERVASELPGSIMVPIPGAGHAAGVGEDPCVVNLIAAFLAVPDSPPTLLCRTDEVEGQLATPRVIM